MKKRIIYVLLAIVFIISLILTATIGLKVDLNYAEGNTITFTVGKEISTEEIQSIAQEIWGKNKALVQEVEMFGDSALIKTREDVTDENLNSLCTKINEKYEVELTTSDFSVSHIPNTKLRNLIEPYIIPIGLSTLLIALFYAIRFKEVKRMFDLIKYLIIAEGVLYSIYAICRVPIGELTMPLALIAYTLVVLIYSTTSEIIESKKEKNNSKKVVKDE